MDSNFEPCLAIILKAEGGYVNRKDDPGGATNLGVTKRVWENYVGHGVTLQTMQKLTPTDVGPLYKKEYWDVCGCPYWPNGVDLMVFDCAVNQGPGVARNLLQQAVGVTADGKLGPVTTTAVKSKPASETISDYALMRMDRYRRTRNFDTFGKGWTNRVNAVKVDALRMAESP